MSSKERSLRSRLAQMISSQAFFRGTLVSRERICGSKNCKCLKGEKHPGLYLDIREDGKHRQIFIPKSLENNVRYWVQQSQKIRQLLEDLSRIYWKKIKKREI